MRRTSFAVVGIIILCGIWLALRRPPVVATEVIVVPTTNQGKTYVAVRRQFFSWQEIESPDYQVYLKNLRDIGCPESTIRDIIIADVNQLYTRKRIQDIMTPDQQWWRADPDTNAVLAVATQLQALEQERRTLLASLLGTNWDAPDPAATRPLVALNGPVLGAMTPEAKQLVQAISARSRERTQAYLDAQKASGQPASPAELAKIDRETRAELAKVMSPQQLEEFLLRYSPSAASLRNQLRGFDATPDEFRALFRLADPINQTMQTYIGDDAAKAAEQTVLAKQLAEGMKTVLGPKRYDAYLLSQDQDYQDARALADEFGATEEVSQKLYQLNKAARQEQQRIQNDATLTPEQKAAQLAAMQQQQTTATDQLLGVPPPAPAADTAAAPPAPPPAAATQPHSFSPGETVDALAARYGVTSLSIMNANPNLDFNGLQRGTIINIPAPPSQPTQ